MSRILSIQSHVAHGYVGNCAAVFPLQRLGHDVNAINTVQFSNTTGYGDWEGDVFSPDHIQRILTGIERRGVMEKLNAMLTGFMGSAQLGHIMLNIAQEMHHQTHDFIYCCDPVLGDVGRDIFVPMEVAEFFRDVLIKYADILTPNQYELGYLTGMPCDTLDQILAATDQLRTQGPSIILVTSVFHPDMPDNHIGMLVNTVKGNWVVYTPYLALDPAPNGAGDLTAALFLARYLETRDPKVTLEYTMASVYRILEATANMNSRDLQLVVSQEALVTSSRDFIASVIK